MMLCVARKKHRRHAAAAELALDGVRGAKGRLLLEERIWHQDIDESPTRRLMGVRSKVCLDPRSCKIPVDCDGPFGEQRWTCVSISTNWMADGCAVGQRRRRSGGPSKARRWP